MRYVPPHFPESQRTSGDSTYSENHNFDLLEYQYSAAYPVLRLVMLIFWAAISRYSISVLRMEKLTISLHPVVSKSRKYSHRRRPCRLMR